MIARLFLWLEGSDPYFAWGLAIAGEILMILGGLLLLFGGPIVRAFRFWRVRRELQQSFQPIDVQRSKHVHRAVTGRIS